MAFQYLHRNPLGQYSPAEYTDARAFVVLSHGVIEEYLERASLEVVDTALQSFDKDGKPRTALLSLLAHSPSATRVPPETHTGGSWLVGQHLHTARQALWSVVHRNHGLTERHLLSLLLPSGIRESELGAEWLQQMTNLGDTRGRVAHGSSRPPGAETPLDPGDAAQCVLVVLPGLCRVDSRLLQLRDE